MEESMAQYQTDTKVKGLRIYPTGYYVYYRIDGRRRVMKLANTDILIGVARNKAQKILGEVAQGIDPLEAKKVEADAYTLNQAFELKLEDLFNNNKKCVEMKDGKIDGEPRRMWDRDVKNTLGKMKLESVETGDITKLHIAVSKRAKYQANRVVQLISSVFENSIRLSLVKYNPAKYVKKNPEMQRDRPLTDKEFAEINKQINIIESQTHERHLNSIKYIRLCILTGGRCVSEIGSAKWSDLDGNKLVLEEHKTDYQGKPRVIHLNNQAMAIINSCDRNSETILGVKYPFHTWNKIRKAAGCPDVTFHDLRHNFGTMAGEQMKIEDVKTLMGHKSIKATERYRKTREHIATEEMQNVGNYMQKIMMSN
jgi:integrase